MDQWGIVQSRSVKLFIIWIGVVLIEIKKTHNIIWGDMMIQDEAHLSLEQLRTWNKSVQQGRWSNSNLMTQTWICQKSQGPLTFQITVYFPMLTSWVKVSSNSFLITSRAIWSLACLGRLPHINQGYQEMQRPIKTGPRKHRKRFNLINDDVKH